MRRTERVKPYTCPQCGGTNQAAPRGPYVECESCSAVIDFDGATARRSPDWYASVIFELQALARAEQQLRRTIEAADRVAWRACYGHVLKARIEKFPSMFPSAVKDAAYRERFVAWLLATYECLYWEAETQRFSTAMAMIDVPIEKGIANSAAFWRRTEVAEKLYAAQARMARVLGNTPPEKFPADFVRRMNVSLYVQEWLHELADKDAQQLLERMGLHHDYALAATTAGEYACTRCGAEVQLPADATLIICPYCRSALRSTSAPPTIGPRQWAALGEWDAGLGDTLKHVRGQHPTLAIADGTACNGQRHVLLQVETADRVTTAADRELEPDWPFGEFLHAWTRLEAEKRKLPLERRWLREHRDAKRVPADARALDARLAELGAPNGRARAMVTGWGTGCACDVVIAVETGMPAQLRLVRDDGGAGRALYASWAAAFNARQPPPPAPPPPT
jgi:DNA-directed RNA polymerase subunit RPC12/RpoP